MLVWGVRADCEVWCCGCSAYVASSVEVCVGLSGFAYVCDKKVNTRKDDDYSKQRRIISISGHL